MMELDDLVFVKKYQPKHVKDVIGDFTASILKYLDKPMAMPSFLFSSLIPGTGKTTLARAIINDLKCDKLILNSSKDRKIETVRETIGRFVMSESISQGTKKCVFLDEFDGMTKDAQNALRNMMEVYNDNCFFILTCNHVNKVEEAIKSRCMYIDFTKPSRPHIVKYLTKICQSEGISHDTKGINKLISIHYPSIRNMVKTLQEYSMSKKSITENTVSAYDEKYEVLYDAVKSCRIGEVRKKIIQGEVIPQEVNLWLFDRVFEDALAKKLKASAVGIAFKILAQNERDFRNGCNDKMIFITSMFDLAQVLKP